MAQAYCAISHFKFIRESAILIPGSIFFIGCAGFIAWALVNFGSFPTEANKILYMTPAFPDSSFEILPADEAPEVNEWVREETFGQLIAENEKSVTVFITGDSGTGRRLGYQVAQLGVSWGYRGDLVSSGVYSASGTPTMNEGQFAIPASRSIFWIPGVVLGYAVAVVFVFGLLFGGAVSLWLWHGYYRKWHICPAL